jgi:hypothetical protein
MGRRIGRVQFVAQGLRRASRSFGESTFAQAASAGLSVNDIEGRLDLELLESLEDRMEVTEADGVFTLTLLSESGEVEASTIVAVPISVAFTGPNEFGEVRTVRLSGLPAQPNESTHGPGQPALGDHAD